MTLTLAPSSEATNAQAGARSSSAVVVTGLGSAADPLPPKPVDPDELPPTDPDAGRSGGGDGGDSTGPIDGKGTGARWAGYRIRNTGKASGGWIGGYKLGNSIVYRIDPAAKAGAGYGPAKKSSRLGGKFNALRAAWVISKYGDYRSRTQAAAVDATLLHLLAGKTWGINGKKGKARLRQSGHAGDIRRYANYMLNHSAKLAGPYRIRIGSTPLIERRKGTIAVRVASRRGRPIKQLPVTVKYPGHGPRNNVTGAGGTVRFPTTIKRHQILGVHALVRKLPATALLVRNPSNKHRSRILVAGPKQNKTGRTNLLVKAQPGAKVTGPSRVQVGDRTGGKVLIAHTWKKPLRAVTTTLYGPYATPKGADCRGPKVTTSRHKLRGNGRFKLTHPTIRRAGFYVWRVGVPSDGRNAGVDVCRGRFKARR